MYGTALFITIFLVFHTRFSHSVSFQLPRFDSDVNLVLLEGDAVNSVGKIEFTNINYLYRVGRVIYNGKVPLWDSQKLADFTTHFSFTVDTENRASYGNGLAFFLAPVGFQIPPNSAGGYLGLFNTTTTSTSSSRAQIVSVEFDTHSNEGWDPKYEHVGININSITSSATSPWNVSLHNGDLADAWIRYDSTTRNLSVLWGYGGGPNSSLSYRIDLKEVLPQWVTIGIFASTGTFVERHTLASWDFTSSSLDIDETDVNNRSSKKNIGLIVGVALSGCILIAGGVLAYVVVSRKKQDQRINPDETRSATTSMMVNDDDLERGVGPRKFAYKDLASATDNFSDKKKLGEGGFGGVYKGHLIDLNIPIAVKKFSGRSKHGKKQYVTEVKIISMLRHRNLVRLIGWSHDQGEFLLVYEFMPNGSLDHHLFRRENILSWTQRYKIALGLASALLYLHEEWEQCVVHRDIKSSNIMLDSSFNVKLGDFGLARLMDHGLDPQTTGLAGTFGYMAPEYVNSGRASKESDVYSFGVVALEIATGKKSFDPLNVESNKSLVGWVWDLYGNGELLSGVDESVLSNLVTGQAERLMIVGLWCAHPDYTLRPSIRQASRVLNFEADLPKLETKMPVPVFNAPESPSVSSRSEPFSITTSSMNVGR
ncbi:PREDICTED: LOW QUALITY PROTEIN: L-type lectin-domain containing receptor kinase IX.1-like [Erythranthe guttata]|uniref:LOW QUALITY PROTEIN: L-type lectin-domain containing receptor kinase IX.1-like n=1 Tax=Erythranthe guttata TaxID=4155 RepID=UPI00064DDE52|nr:PREDICTED: LOW QUALITY PROTEIN: L-type lectin-domain containing receptor kinase IX.1-like [Erythranthe guttata]|eukprot:XP_012832534.1 PREDICTED: LOW QUALITY PROTEIN: L-type lectin-domain containing receptor kinase IX.1-like [Erythranthe guttata]